MFSLNSAPQTSVSELSVKGEQDHRDSGELSPSCGADIWRFTDDYSTFVLIMLLTLCKPHPALSPKVWMRFLLASRQFSICARIPERHGCVSDYPNVQIPAIVRGPPH